MILIKSSETLNLNGLTHNDLLGVVQIAIRDTEERLQQFAQRPDFREKMILAFGTSPEGLQGAWANGVRNVGFKAKEDSGIVVFIDPSVSDYQTLQAGVAEGVEAIALNPNQDGIKQITAVLRQHPEITTIHIVSHGAPGCLDLGNSQLNLDNISKYADLLQHWQSKSILLYGCNVAAGDVGEEFIRKLHQITKANIRASATKTGNAALGGNWQLEVSFPVTDDRKSVVLAFCPDVLAAYSGILALDEPYLVTDINATIYSSNTISLINDILTGNEGNDTLSGREGNDALSGLGGNDNLYGEAGNDTLNGGDGDDYLAPGTGSDSIDGGNGSDYLDIDNRNDTADTTISYTNINNGSITGGSNNGTVFQGIERTRLRTGSGNDNINVSATDNFNDTWKNEIYAGAGNDTVIGSATGWNQLFGEAGDDSLQGGDTNPDHLYGGDGNDALSGLGGNDNLYGEAGKPLTPVASTTPTSPYDGTTAKA